MNSSDPKLRQWNTRALEKARRLALIEPWLDSGVLKSERIVDALEALIAPGDRVALEGNNQKQADFLSRAFAKVDPARVHDVHLLLSSISRPEHLALFENGIAHKVDFSFAGPQSLRVAQLLEDGKLEIGAIYTYIELYARMFIDLTPQVSLVCAVQADRQGNLYTGANTEDTPTIVEATAFRHGIVVAQVNEIVDELPRVDIPASWVDVVVKADRPFAVEPLFTRDPRHIGELQILMAMMTIRGIYERYGVTTLNHGIGFDTAAIELLLPTYGESLGLKGKICRNWALNPHPTLIPAIESGWVESVHCFGSEVGMENYIAERSDVFFTGRDGSLRSNRVLCQLAGQYGVDLFIGSTLQMDADANSSTVTLGRLAGFGGAPNMGHDPRGRRHSSEAWLKLMKSDGPNPAIGRGHKLVVQTAETFKKGGEPTIVDALDAIAVGEKSGMPIAPVMIYGDDVSHVVTEEGIAYLHAAEGVDERRAALAAVAGVTPIGMRADPAKTAELRRRGIVAFPEDLGVRRGEAKRSLLAARSIDDLVAWSGGLYAPPAKFRSW
ncbi:malonate decarboxylase subunit alpha [Caballeronia arationis]|jgi:malonate decarboxylase alpha subunit|uniref:Malonate decarboxylase alpha subunit n=1 Tax=Caballeronia arationis TaxID=1777142 RepID=A0A7Z7IAH9_9BURK|nr:malonate decarboxylase subunit alpha [Caballeronia arationis]SAK68263.1 malonate decarboxylase subunit alpha [Caballeronia arationis]SOE81952.1 malonate decarboxylase alpha subunit [Caballeronia arationis]